MVYTSSFHCGANLGKRSLDDSPPTTPAPPTKKRKDNETPSAYPTPESVQLSSSGSSGTTSSIIEKLAERVSASVDYDFRSRLGPLATKGPREWFLEEISNYTALGSFTFSLDNEDGTFIPDTHWSYLTPNHRKDGWEVLSKCLSPQDHGCIIAAREMCVNGLACISFRRHRLHKNYVNIRVHALSDDVGRRYVPRYLWRGTPTLRNYLRFLIHAVDTSPDSWKGCNSIEKDGEHYDLDTREDESLFYLFNTLPPPKLEAMSVSDPLSNEAIQSVSSTGVLPGLITQLYRYQQRTVAKMIQREVEPKRTLDPRFQELRGPEGSIFFYDSATAELSRDGRQYEEVRGGILGESMGLGKTLICLATIVATRGHWPQVPPEYSLNLHPIRSQVGSLVQMAAAAVGRSYIPWRVLLNDALRAGVDHQNVMTVLEENVGSYIIPPLESKYSRRSRVVKKGKRIPLSTATLVIVPDNLLSQWKAEIKTHVKEDCLQILYLETSDELPIPSVDDLLKYDIILVSKPRFEKEMVPSERLKASSKTKRSKGRCRCSLDEDCNCSRHEAYESPLKDIHWLRIIMDEGHEFSSSGRSGNGYWAIRGLRVDRKWIVSGTPANGLMGVEVGSAINETSETPMGSQNVSARELLEARRKESALSQERKDLERLGVLVRDFLQVKPWANSKEEDGASWQKYIMPHQDGRRKARSLKTLLESLVVRHRIEDVEADIQLPPLHNRVIYLQPCWHDKLSINLFILYLTTNAITSERVDEDYMFHSKNRRRLNELINNLRQAGFYWTGTGMSPEAVAKTMQVSRTYLEEHQNNASDCSGADKKLLYTTIQMGEATLASKSWRSFAELHEMGIFVSGFPEEARNVWSLIPTRQDDPALVGATQLAKAQEWVDSHLYANDLSDNFVKVGAATMQKLWQVSQQGTDNDVAEERTQIQRAESQIGSIPQSSAAKLPRLLTGRTVSRAKANATPPKPIKAVQPRDALTPPRDGDSANLKPALKSALKSTSTKEPVDLLPSDSPLGKSRICGTASAKLSYLLQRVTVLHQNEKILIFYEGDQIAWYIAQALDLMAIRYLIYTKSLSVVRRTAYIDTFNQTETFRVLLMNVHQAAHGLHIASASRVFFVNPVWQPNVEAQAIKRAHRIGQTRPVYVETLVLKDTLEDQMLQRRKAMTAQEHHKAEQSLLDDDTMSSIIKNAQFIPLLEAERNDLSKQMARLETPYQIFARTGKGEGNVDDPDADLIFPVGTPVSKKQKKSNKRRSVPARVPEGTTPSEDPMSRPNLISPPPTPSPTVNRSTLSANGSHQAPSDPALGSVNALRPSRSENSGLNDNTPIVPSASTQERNPVTFNTSSSPEHQTPSLITSGPSKRRVGFVIDMADQNDDETSGLQATTCRPSKKRVGFVSDIPEPPEQGDAGPTSLFGDGSPSKPMGVAFAGKSVGFALEKR